jgi:hypothetical protein
VSNTASLSAPQPLLWSTSDANELSPLLTGARRELAVAITPVAGIERGLAEVAGGLVDVVIRYRRP